jgi:transcriptional regulator PpsR
MCVLAQMFKSPKETLGDLGAQAAAALIVAATDVAVVIDRQGVVRDVAFSTDELSLELGGQGRWLGARLASLVSSETRGKVDELLRAAVLKKPAVWRQVNHPAAEGGDIPILYSVVGIGRSDRFVVVGRDLRPLAVAQQRLVAAQQSMERDYLRLRHAETRYRLLFQVASEATVMIDAKSLGVIDANPAALALLDQAAPQVLRSNLAGHFEAEDAAALRQFFGAMRATGRDQAMQARLKDGRLCTVSASLFRQETGALFLVRLAAEPPAPGGAMLKASSLLLRYFIAAPDAMAITEADGRLLRANTAFLDMAQLTGEEQTRGENLERWLGRAGIDFGVILAALRQSGSVKMFATVLRGSYGASTDVEVSAVTLSDGEERPNLGFAIRNVEMRLSAAAATARQLPHSMAQLTEMIGRVPLRDLVRETTDVIEKLSIEAALELTGDNRASAAEVLGLSRQSLYVKLRRFGIVDHAAEDESDDE